MIRPSAHAFNSSRPAMRPSIEALIASTFNIPIEQVTPDSDMSTLQNWDSLGHINLVLAIEEAYGVVVDEDAVVELTSVRAIREFVERTASV
jgi:citrate synthase